MVERPVSEQETVKNEDKEISLLFLISRIFSFRRCGFDKILEYLLIPSIIYNLDILDRILAFRLKLVDKNLEVSSERGDKNSAKRVGS